MPYVRNLHPKWSHFATNSPKIIPHAHRAKSPGALSDEIVFGNNDKTNKTLAVVEWCRRASGVCRAAMPVNKMTNT